MLFCIQKKSFKGNIYIDMNLWFCKITTSCGSLLFCLVFYLDKDMVVFIFIFSE